MADPFLPVRSILTRVEVTARVAGLALILLVFFIVGAPLQWLVLRLNAGGANVLPRLFYRCVLFFVKMRVRVRGAPAGAPQLIVANHVSWTDIPALGSICPISFLAKREIANWPIVGTFARLQQSIFIDRGRRQSVADANARIALRLAEGCCIALFPEGTTYDGAELGPFRSAHFGAAQISAVVGASSRIQPVAIRYSSAHAAWCGDALLLPHVTGLMGGEPVTCELIFCPTLEFAIGADRKTIAQQCRSAIAAALAGTNSRDAQH